MRESFRREIETAYGGTIKFRENVPADRLTTFAVGAPASLLAEPATPEGVARLLAHCANAGEPVRLLGAGSNVVLPDHPVEDVIVHLGREFDFISPLPLGDSINPSHPLPIGSVVPTSSAGRFFVGGATSLMGLSRKLSAAGYSGLEFAAGIPASVGGAVRMNAGAHHSCMANVLESALLAEPNGDLRLIAATDLGFGYRHSTLPTGSMVLGAIFAVSPRAPDEIAREREACLAYRKKTQPLHLPSAGSVFRNPVPASESTPIFAARLIEECGLKGFRQGGVAFSEMHANWLVRVAPDAKSHEVRDLIFLARQMVFQHSQIELQQEIILWESASGDMCRAGETLTRSSLAE